MYLQTKQKVSFYTDFNPLTFAISLRVPRLEVVFSSFPTRERDTLANVRSIDFVEATVNRLLFFTFALETDDLSLAFAAQSCP